MRQLLRGCKVALLPLFTITQIATLASCSQETAESVTAPEAAAPGRVVLSIDSGHSDGQHSSDIRVTITNDSAVPVCIERSYAALTRLEIYDGDERPRDLPYAFEGRPIPGCTELQPGSRLLVEYLLADLGLSIDDVVGERVCYATRWRVGGYSEASLDQRGRVCAEWE